MDIGNILNDKRGAIAAAAGGIHGVKSERHHLQSHMSQHNNHMSPDSMSDQSTSPHGMDHSRYTVPSMNNGMHVMGHNLHYQPSTPIQSPLPILPGYRQHNNYHSSMNMVTQQGPPPPMKQELPAESPVVKAFPCSTCQKGFARRSDLARHERIHSGIRPHLCEHPGCGKQFIQRSALTVHSRVHTGEKPHMCECCGKPFSDSSSLARHRRIHSGQRPYKCPFADCQKTFTRRTTLTRHQNGHTGTVEEAAEATAAALASRPANASRRSERQTRSDSDQYSQQDSPISTKSPLERSVSIPPKAEFSTTMSRPDYPYMHNSSIPSHLRDNFHIQPQSHPLTPIVPSYSNNMRPTSHPGAYGHPPPVLEPPTHTPSGSTHASPHMSNVGWHSPQNMASPTHQSHHGYVYPDPDPYSAQMNMAQMGHIFYPNSNIRRPQSTEPDHYHEPKPRMQHEMWAGAS